MKKIIISWLIIVWTMTGCKTTKLDTTTGDRNPSWNTKHLDKIHKRIWHAGNDIIIPAGFKPYPMDSLTVKK